MSVASAISGTVRALVVAALTAGGAFGLLAVFHPFASPVMETGAAGAGDTNALHESIERALAALAETEAAIGGANATSITVTPASPDATLLAQYETQIAAATERRDLSRRHAAAIREGLKSGMPLAALAEIRDSAVIGQLLAQQTALDAQIAEQGARFKPAHPVMRALFAQRDALATQIRGQAAGVAAALEAEGELDDKQIKLLQAQLSASTGASTDTASSRNAALKAQAVAQRAEFDALMDAYFGHSSAATAEVAAPGPLGSPLNLLVVAVAASSALIFQVTFAARHGRLRTEAADLASWQADHDGPEPALEDGAEVRLRRAS